MNTIDWSKAPEGATHYRASIKTFYKQDIRAYEWDTVEWRMISNDLGEFRWSSDLIERPAIEWTGEGLPSVGSYVIVHDADGTLMYGHGESGEVLAHIENTAVIRMSYGLGCFTARNLRTPEQIAENERKQAIDDLVKVTCITHGEAARIYDAGYRKQVTP